MARDVLDEAKILLGRRQFSKAIKLLEGRAEIYSQDFEYNLLFAIACLYLGDTGTASVFFQKARNIRLTDTRLLLGQAALFLRRGDTDRALYYYLEILDNDPQNKIAVAAIEFIRINGDYNTICRWVDTGRIEQFYPSLGLNPYKIAGITFPIIACVLGIVLVMLFIPVHRPSAGNRADLSSLALTIEERRNIQETNLASGSFAYIMSASQINESYEKAQNYFLSYRDNLSQVEINRILNSNASVYVKQKANILMGYLEEPGFDTLKDFPSYKNVQNEPVLYLDCWVVWSGRVSNVVQTETLYKCDFLVGYDTMENVEGIVPLSFDVIPLIDNEKPVKVLAKIKSVDGRLALEGRAVHQSVKN